MYYKIPGRILIGLDSRLYMYRHVLLLDGGGGEEACLEVQ